jgi:hypothetical protein
MSIVVEKTPRVDEPITETQEVQEETVQDNPKFTRGTKQTNYYRRATGRSS